MGFTFGPLTPAQVAALAGPAASAPPGIMPFSSPSSSSPALDWALIAIFTSVALLAVLMRLFVRIVITRPLYIEDAWIIMALAAHIVISVLEAIMVNHGIGKHMWDITLRDFLNAIYYLHYTNGAYCLEMLCIKVAIPLQFLRLFVADRRLNQPLWIACWLSIIINALFYAPNIFIQIFICTPFDKAWNPFVTGHCLDYQAILRTTGVFNIISDFVLLLLPLWGIWQLPVKIKRKIAVTSIFAAGFFACVAPVLRTYYTWRVHQMKDISYNARVQGYTTQIEMTLGLLVFCVPSAPQFYSFLRRKLRRSVSDQSSNTGDVEKAQLQDVSKSMTDSYDSVSPTVSVVPLETPQSYRTTGVNDSSITYFNTRRTSV